MSKFILGIDVGTSGIRGCVVSKAPSSQQDNIIIEKTIDLAIPKVNKKGEFFQNPALWIEVLEQLLFALSHEFELKKLTHIVVDATSSTVLLQDQNGNVISDAIMYNDGQSTNEAQKITEILAENGRFSGATGASSTLAKALRLIKAQKHSTKQSSLIICHQVDLVNHYLCGQLNTTDENNALKLGFNSIEFAWPVWVKDLLAEHKLSPPNVVKPGTLLGNIREDLVRKFQFNSGLEVMAGTTDSIAGFLAAGATNIGEAVTSLGSTLAIKLISDKPVFNAEYGLYSHRLGKNWLVGGASNSGGRVFLSYYNIAQLNKLSQQANQTELSNQTDNGYYPLADKGERFPIADSNLEPHNPVFPNCNLDLNSQRCFSEHRAFTLALCKGLTNIESMAYQKLSELTQSDITQIYSLGGGTKNKAWMQFREQELPASVTVVPNSSAAYGVTKLIN